MKAYLFYTLIILLIGLGLYPIVSQRLGNKSNGQKISDYRVATITLGEQAVRASIADTAAKRSLGLSSQKSLAENAGLFFIFDQPGNYDFWMKKMNFPLDIIWLDGDLKVVDISPNLATSTYPKSFTSRVPAQYVLEVNAGWTDRHQVKIGDQAGYK